MQVPNGDPGSAGVSTSLLPKRNVRALDGDGFPQIAGYGGMFAKTVPRPPEERQQPFGFVANEQAGSTTASWSDRPAGSLPKTWPGGLGEVFEPARREQPARLVGPVQFVLKLLDLWHLEKPDAIGLLGFDGMDIDYVESVLEGYERIRGRDVRDRISHLFWIYRSLRSLFRDLEVENDWLRERHSFLDDKTPMSLLLSGSMEDLLLVRDYVDAASGR